ncbi:MAG: nucleotide exchange factor GrpE [Thermoanaerobaculia bacterium]|nr:nucleotide exchange factor GrpE [Thermoanaerobaculia bacterium]
MSDHDPDESGVEEADFLIEEEDSDDLESAFQEALEAVEKREGGGGNGSPSTADVVASPEPGEDEEGLPEQLVRSRERLARALADFDNFRKRTERERAALRRYDGFEVLRSLVEIVDNLERALAAEGSADDLRQGIELIVKQMHALLQRAGVHRVESVGEPFDPRVHEAMMRHEDPEVDEPTVDLELQPGYQMHDRLLRPARVRVAMPADGDGEPE